MRTATIASGENLSHKIDVGNGKFHGLSIPAGWAAGATAITFQVSHDGVTWQDLYNDTGTEVSATAAASRNVSLSSIALDLAPWRFIKIRSGTSASAVTQDLEGGAEPIEPVTADLAGGEDIELVLAIKD